MLQLRPYSLKYSIRYPRAIIIHSTNELDLNSGEITFDRPSFQTSKLQNIYFAQKNSKEIDLPYNFILERVGNDYQIITIRPILTKCIFLDIPERKYDDAIHLALIGNYSENIPTDRLYKVLAYRLLVPYSRTFRIGINNIFLHRELSNNPKIDCPGEFFNKNKMIRFVKAYQRKVSVTRF